MRWLDILQMEPGLTGVSLLEEVDVAPIFHAKRVSRWPTQHGGEDH